MNKTLTRLARETSDAPGSHGYIPERRVAACSQAAAGRPTARPGHCRAFAQATAQSDPARVTLLKERASVWLSQQSPRAIRSPLPLSPAQQQALDDDFDAALMEIRARSSRYSEAEIAAALIEARALAPDVSRELDAELAAILAEWA